MMTKADSAGYNGVGDAARLQDIDVNLLVVLCALLEEQSVTRAAARLGRTQSAVSHALGRLRELMGDPLLTRTPSGMEPTVKAQELLLPLREALILLQRVLQPAREFDAQTAEGTLRLGAADYFASVLLPRFVEAIATQAPGIRIVITATADDAAGQLVTGELDLALGVFGKLPQSLYRQKLFEDSVVCLVREGHPILKKLKKRGELNLKQYLSLKHAQIATGAATRSAVDHELDRLKKVREVVLRLPHFLAAPKIIAKTDYIISLPWRLANEVAASTPVEILSLPLVQPKSVFYQAWHERSHGVDAHRWLRELLTEVARAEPQVP
jgi:DNA-binding transcriptional LysR family regulator